MSSTNRSMWQREIEADLAASQIKANRKPFDPDEGDIKHFMGDEEMTREEAIAFLREMWQKGW